MGIHGEIIQVLGGSHAFAELLKKHPTSEKLKKQVLRDLKLELRKLRVVASFLVQGSSVPKTTKTEYKKRFDQIQILISKLDQSEGGETGSMCKLDGGIRSCDLSAESAHRQLMGKPSFKEEARRRLIESKTKCEEKHRDFKSNNPETILDTVSTIAKTECIDIQIEELKTIH